MEVVEAIPGERLTFLVASRRPNVEPYLVDLEEFGGNGWCGCQDFEFHCMPALERGAAPSDSLRCYHIQVARLFCRKHQIQIDVQTPKEDQTGSVDHSLSEPFPAWLDKIEIAIPAKNIQTASEAVARIPDVHQSVVEAPRKPALQVAGMPSGGEGPAPHARAVGGIIVRRNAYNSFMQISSYFSWQ